MFLRPCMHECCASSKLSLSLEVPQSRLGASVLFNAFDRAPPPPPPSLRPRRVRALHPVPCITFACSIIFASSISQKINENGCSAFDLGHLPAATIASTEWNAPHPLHRIMGCALAWPGLACLDAGSCALWRQCPARAARMRIESTCMHACTLRPLRSAYRILVDLTDLTGPARVWRGVACLRRPALRSTGPCMSCIHACSGQPSPGRRVDRTAPQRSAVRKVSPPCPPPSMPPSMPPCPPPCPPPSMDPCMGRLHAATSVTQTHLFLQKHPATQYRHKQIRLIDDRFVCSFWFASVLMCNADRVREAYARIHPSIHERCGGQRMHACLVGAGHPCAQ